MGIGIGFGSCIYQLGSLSEEVNTPHILFARTTRTLLRSLLSVFDESEAKARLSVPSFLVWFGLVWFVLCLVSWKYENLQNHDMRLV